MALATAAILLVPFSNRRRENLWMDFAHMFRKLVIRIKRFPTYDAVLKYFELQF